MTIFGECLRSQSLAGVGPLQVSVRNAGGLLPARVKNGRVEVGAAGGLGVALGGHIEPLPLCPGDHLNQPQRVLEPHARNMDDISDYCIRRRKWESAASPGIPGT